MPTRNTARTPGRRRRRTLTTLMATAAIAVGTGPFSAIAMASHIPPEHLQPTPRDTIGVIATATTARDGGGSGAPGS